MQTKGEQSQSKKEEDFKIGIKNWNEDDPNKKVNKQVQLNEKYTIEQLEKDYLNFETILNSQKNKVIYLRDFNLSESHPVIEQNLHDLKISDMNRQILDTSNREINLSFL